MTRTLATRLARAEAALARGPNALLIYSTEQMAAVLRSLGRPDDDAAVRWAQGELHEDGPLRDAWLAAGHEIGDTMMFLYPDDWLL